MTNFDLADAFDKVAEGFAAAAMALRIGPETPQDASGAFADGTPRLGTNNWKKPYGRPQPTLSSRLPRTSGNR